MAAPVASVLLLTRDGMDTLPRVLASVRSQAVSFPFEIVAVDSGSRDGTAGFLRSQADRLVEIPAHEFNHGTTRNLGVEACLAPLVALLVQDAEPASEDWLARLVAPLREDHAEGQAPGGGRLAGTYARQVPRADASAVARMYLSRHLAAGPAPRRQSVAGRTAFDALSPAQRLAVCTFDNVCACIRRDVWHRHPFKEAPIAEDLEWAREVLLAGYDLAYVPEAAVRHSHNRPAGYEFRRARLVHRQLRRLFGLATIPSPVHLARAIAVSAAAHARWTLAEPGTVRSRLSALPRALALAVAMPLGQYLGARSADAGRAWPRERGV
jgi:rhamnosyltransferase